jgi:hypothetical protein
MRVTTIPAQVTTVEDHITGNLNLMQLILLCIPVFTGGLLFAVVPPVMHLAAYKLPLILVITTLCGVSAIRIKGKIILFWITILLHYWLRPRYYIFDKHSTHGRKQYSAIPEVAEEETVVTSKRAHKPLSLSLEDMTRVQELLENPAANVAFKTRKGGLYVRVTEVRQEG